MLTASPEVIHNELETAIAILTKWKERTDKIPGVHIPVQGGRAPEALENWLREMVGELQLVSAKCDALAEVLATATA